MVSSFVKRGLDAVTSRQTNIFSAALFIILTTIISQALGFLKYRLLVSIFGASSDLGVFFASFRIPDFLFQVLVAGALTSSFIPVFSEYLSRKKQKEAFMLSSSLLTISISVFAIISLGIIIFAYPLARLVVPGFSESELHLTANLMRIIQLSQLFFIVGTLITAMLQSFQHFLIPGIATAFYNVGIILGLLLFAPRFGIYSATIGVLIGSMLFCAVQLPLLKMTGFSFSLSFVIHSGVMRIYKLMLPRALTLLVTQFAVTANIFFASFISARSIVIYDLAQTLVMAPVFLLGVSIAQASFPALSLKADDKEGFLAIFRDSFNQILYLTFPVSAILIVLRIPAVRLFFGADRFDWDATVSTGLTLALFSLSLAAQALMFLLSRAFYALKDTKTPFIITIIGVSVNVFFAFLFVKIYALPIYSVALAFSIGTIVSTALLIICIDQKIHLPKLEIIFSLSKILIATIVMGIALYIPIKLLDQLVFDTTRTVNLIMLTGIASFTGFIVYVFFTWLLDIHEAYYIIRVAKRLGSWNKMMKQIKELIDEPKLNS